MKKASVLVIVSVLLAALLCLAGCGSSSSDEGYSSSDTGGAKGASHSKSVTFGDSDAGIIGTLSGDWEDLSYFSSGDYEFVVDADKKESGHDRDTFAYYSCDNGSYREYIWGDKYSGYKGEKITDYSKEAISEMYSEVMPVDNVKKKKLDSGTYYVVKGTSSDGELYYVIYDIIKNGYDIRYEYESYGGESDTPHLSDFEKMVNNVDYFDPAGHDKD